MKHIIDFLSLSLFDYNILLGFAGICFGIMIFLTYLISVYKNYGILKSISISYYSVEPHWLFQMFMWGSIFSILCIGQNMCYLIVSILFGIMTCNPTINRGNIYFIPHVISAFSAIGLSLIGLYLIYNLKIFFLICLLSLIITFLFVYNKKEKIYIIEVESLSFLIIGLLISLLLKI